MSNERKTQQLGMSFNKASGRLKKMYLLHLLQRLGEDKCYRCGQAIETVDDLSLDHKEPWVGVSVDLFWDLNNIAYSHLACNSRAGSEGKPWSNARRQAQVERARKQYVSGRSGLANQSGIV